MDMGIVLLDTFKKALEKVNSLPADSSKKAYDKLESDMKKALSSLNAYYCEKEFAEMENMQKALEKRVFLYSTKRTKDGFIYSGEYTDIDISAWMQYRKDNFLPVENGKEIVSALKEYSNAISLYIESDISTENGGSIAKVQKALSSIFAAANIEACTKIDRKDVRYINDALTKKGKAVNTIAQVKEKDIINSLHYPYNRIVKNIPYTVEKKNK